MTRHEMINLFNSVANRHQWKPGAKDAAAMAFASGTNTTSAAAIQKVYAAIARSYSAEELAK